MPGQNTEKPRGQPENPLGYAPIPGLIAKFAIPSIVSLLVTAIYNLTDQVFIGHVVGMLGNGATTAAFPVVTITSALAQLVGIGTASNFNISLGAKRREDAKGFVGAGLTLGVLLGVLVTVVILLLKTPILLLCGATENVLPYAQQYLGITLFGIPFLLFSSISSHIIRADGSPTHSMAFTVVGAVLNIFLDWLLMFVIPLGIRGAAIATVIGQVVSGLLCLGYYTRFKTFPIQRACLRLRPSYLIPIFKLGLPNFLNQTIITLVNIVMNNTLTHYGAQSVYGSDIPLAVSGIILKLNTIMTSFSVGLALGCQPIFSFNTGAKNFARVKKTYKTAFCFTMVISLTAFALFQLFPRQIVSIFGSGDELYFQFAVQYMRIFLMMVCVFGVQPLSVNYFTSTGNTRQGITLSLSRQGFFLIPLLLLLPLRFGLDGALYAGPIADSLAFLLSLTLVMRSFKRLPT